MWCIVVVAIFPAIETRAQDPPASSLLDLASTISVKNQQYPETLHHQVLVLDDGFESFVLRINLVRAAKKTIDIQTFIWSDDVTSRYFGQELFKASQRGVKIRLLVDHMWSAKDPNRLAWNAEHVKGFEIKLYRPIAKRIKPSLPRKIANIMTPNETNQRMHNKTMLVDSVIGITGGRNIGNNYFDYSTKYNFKDREILVIGPAVDEMLQSFQLYWDFKHVHASDELRDVARKVQKGALEVTPNHDDYDLPYFRSLNRLSNDQSYIVKTFIEPSMCVKSATFVSDKPGKKTWFYFFHPRGGGALTETMEDYLNESEERVIIQSPYVILNRRSRHMMKKSQKHSPNRRVQLSTNSFGAADHLATYSANYRLRTKVIRGLGFEIYEYKPHPEDLYVYLENFDALNAMAEEQKLRRSPYVSIHSKTYTFDSTSCFIGTYNLDPRSFYINSECGIFVHDEAFTQDVAQRLLRDMTPSNSWVIARKQRPLGKVNLKLEGLSSFMPIDLWPVRYTSSFELKADHEQVPSSHPDFYNRYRDMGNFPGSDGLGTQKTLTRIYKKFGKSATPLL